jgi:hypothetical protein
MPVELKGTQIRIRVLDPKRFTKFRTQDVGRKGRLQRIAGYSPKTGWKTQSWRLNVKGYKNFYDFEKDLLGLDVPVYYKYRAGKLWNIQKR